MVEFKIKRNTIKVDSTKYHGLGKVEFSGPTTTELIDNLNLGYGMYGHSILDTIDEALFAIPADIEHHFIINNVEYQMNGIKRETHKFPGGVQS